MTLFKVDWRSEAVSELAAIWSEHPDRPSVTAAADAIDEALKVDAHQLGELIHEDLRRLDWPPLRVYFEVYPNDAKVYVSMVLVKASS